ncbi:MAG: hypothetical protein COW65_18130 [Cytophagales bacterium CG18_big_fil_WC_8_21_14_2_50_42_9]|nr:MAG: hypothetical protein COW65_18130 [Cytophagales bacterium CG18_big_fil_WC_8_21_14_2_50_42_9]
MSDINSLADALDMIAKITAITNTKEKGSELIHTIKTGFDNFLVTNNIRTAYFIWRKPYMAVGSDTFIHEIMRRASFRNVFAPLSRYSVITPEMLQAANPQLILLSSEPYPFREKHLAEIKQWCTEAIIKLVDGEMFSWYGSRLQYTPAYLRNLQQKVLSEIRN